MYLIEAKDGVIFHLTESRWKHIIEKHPMLRGHYSLINQVSKFPDVIRQSKVDENVYIYHKKVFRGKAPYLVVIGDLKRSNIVTAYPSKNIKGGRVIWPEKSNW